MLSMTALVSVMSILPSYFLSDVQVSAAKAELANIKDINSKNGSNAFSVAISDTKEILSILGPVRTSVSPSIYIEMILEHKTPSIKISGISITSGQKTVATVSGTADTRASLVSFVGALRGDDLVAGVDLPVSDLASSRNIPFSVSVELKIPKI